MSKRWKQLLLAGAGTVALSGLTAAQDADERPDQAGAGSAVSDAAQDFDSLDPNEVEGPGISQEARELRDIAQDNLPDAAEARGEVGAEASAEARADGQADTEGLPNDNDDGDSTGPGSEVSEAAQKLQELDPDEMEDPRVSDEAQDLRDVAQENLPEEALENRREDAGTPGRPDGVGDRPADIGAPDVPDRPATPDRPDTPERPDRPDRPDRPEQPERPERPERPGG